MRVILLVLAAASLVSSRPAAGEQAFPYKAYVTTDDAYVRSGPGENYYPTSKLKAGTTLEVYRHDPGGWYAIRPPEGSFSWIGSRFVKPQRDGLGEITGERVRVRVGTQLTEKRDVVQVHVKRGEIVELLDSRPAGKGRSDETWRKITPPSGEFRWVHGSEIDVSPPGGNGKSSKSPTPLLEAAKPAEAAGGKSADSSSLAKWTPAATPSASPNSTATAVSTRGETPRGPSDGGSRPRTSEQFQKELDELNTELALMLAQDPAAWNGQELGRRARALLDQAQSAVERGHARMLVNRIDQSDDVRRRAVAMGAAATEVDRRGGSLPERSSALGLGSLAGGDGRFDGVGRLARVQQSKLGAPRYALVDDQGNVKVYVSPAPGVAMQPYLGRQVGISGVRGFIAEQNAEHLTAKRIMALDARLR